MVVSIRAMSSTKAPALILGRGRAAESLVKCLDWNNEEMRFESYMNAVGDSAALLS